ncbi:MAG: hypothetical protein ACIPMY_05160 [Rickettsia endosymbiont of Pentastiridius leporinus]
MDDIFIDSKEAVLEFKDDSYPSDEYTVTTATKFELLDSGELFTSV